MKAYLDSVRYWTKKPCLLPLKDCLRSVDESVEEVYVGSEVYCVALLPCPNRVIVGVAPGEVLLVDARLAEVVKRYAGHTRRVDR